MRASTTASTGCSSSARWAFTFIPEATRKCRAASHPSRRTIGLRVPDHAVTQALLEQMGQPLIATTLIAPGEHEPMNDPHEIRRALPEGCRAVVDAGACPMQPTTVVDLTGPSRRLVRQGRGEPQGTGVGRCVAIGPVIELRSPWSLRGARRRTPVE